jgi:DNA excision repair protein ERCC-6-like 2
MGKTGTVVDEQRRYKKVDQLLDSNSINELPDANAEWPTCLIIAPKTVVGNWVRELERVCHLYTSYVSLLTKILPSLVGLF